MGKNIDPNSSANMTMYFGYDLVNNVENTKQMFDSNAYLINDTEFNLLFSRTFVAGFIWCGKQASLTGRVRFTKHEGYKC